MKKPLVIDPGVMRRLATMPRDQRVECLLALCELSETFGRPHLHTGLGIRKLTQTTFECRGNSGWRFLFHNRPNDLHISFLGNHDEVRAALKSGRLD